MQSSNLLMRNQCEYLDQLKEKQRIEHATIREKYQSTKAYVLDLQGRYNGVSAELQNVNEQLREVSQFHAAVLVVILFKLKVTRVFLANVT